MLKDSSHLAAIAKGFAHRHRVSMLKLLSKTSGLSVGELADVLGISFRSASEHSARLVAAGLITKAQSAQQVEHALTRQGKQVLKFLKELKPPKSNW